MNQEHASKEDFKLEKAYEPLADKTLEEILSEGESPEEREHQKERITINNFAQWVRQKYTGERK